jgi:hypothetical protein
MKLFGNFRGADWALKTITVWHLVGVKVVKRNFSGESIEKEGRSNIPFSFLLLVYANDGFY